MPDSSSDSEDCTCHRDLSLVLIACEAGTTSPAPDAGDFPRGDTFKTSGSFSSQADQSGLGAAGRALSRRLSASAERMG